MNLFDQQAQFMEACDQTINRSNPAWDSNTELWKKLIDEEYEELDDACYKLHAAGCYKQDLHEEVLDGAIDLLYVTLGLLNTLGVDPVEAFNILHTNNLTKVCPVTGKVQKTSYGKVMKPESYVPVDFSPLYEK